MKVRTLVTETGLRPLLPEGLPEGRVSVIIGGPGCGKTTLGLQLVSSTDEPTLVVAFEESASDLKRVMKRYGWKSHRTTFIDARVPQSVVHGGDFDVSALLASIGAAQKRTGARRVVFDGIDILLSTLSDPSLVTREAFRLREWVESTGTTAVVTAKMDALPFAKLDEVLQYLAHVVIVLDHRLHDGIAARVVRVAKNRSCAHSANETPFVIGERGIEIVAGSQTTFEHAAPRQRVTSGVERLDTMLDGGYHRASSVLITGSPGTSKTNLSAAFAAACCARKEKTLYVSFDESPAQIVRNVSSVGTPLQTFLNRGLLRIVSLRGRGENPDAHVVHMCREIDTFKARNLVVDPISALATGTSSPAAPAALRLLDFAKTRGVTAVYTSLLASASQLSEATLTGISTIADTWMHVSYVDQGGERNRALTVVKSRGTAHSNQVRELCLTSDGITLADVYSSGGKLLMGTLRWEREEEERRQREDAARDAEGAARDARMRGAEIDAHIASLVAERESLRSKEGAAVAAERDDNIRRQALTRKRSQLRHSDRRSAAKG